MRYFRKLEIASLHLYLSKMGLIKLWSLCFSIFKRPRSPLHPPSHSPLRGTCRCGGTVLCSVTMSSLAVMYQSNFQLPEDFAGKVGDVTSWKLGPYIHVLYIYILEFVYIYIHAYVLHIYIYRYRCNIWNFYCTYIFVYSLNKNAVQPLLYGGLLQPFSLLSCLLTAFDQNPAN